MKLLIRHTSLLLRVLLIPNIPEVILFLSGQCKTQTADYCFHHANENVTTIVPLFSNPKNNSPQSAFYTAPFLSIEYGHFLKQ